MAKVAGLPGILDPAAVSEMLQIAWLHDSLEPDRRPYGTIVAEDLLSEGFSQVVVQGVVLLTPTPGVSHLAGIEHIISFGGLPTILVKLSDNEDNADPEWLATLPEDVQARLLAKYKPSMVMLRDAAPAKEWRG
ncbi:phosphohydrolase [uncultured Methylobacterium sp.]|uniref:phosphohydrolase n=1 Tax=uncultured Methylobacterium sp. TaxID=157278 RepID=UPI0035CBD2F5